MYLHRRGTHWWFRKAVPVDLVQILGIAVVRRSLRTKDSALARRRALQLLIRVDDVYAVLRSKRPLRPTREAALALLSDALEANQGMPWFSARKADIIENAQQTVSTYFSDVEPQSDEDAEPESYVDFEQMVPRDLALQLLRRERPAGRSNEAAVALLNRLLRSMVNR